jgi:hypothetical protein
MHDPEPRFGGALLLCRCCAHSNGVDLNVVAFANLKLDDASSKRMITASHGVDSVFVELAEGDAQMNLIFRLIAMEMAVWAMVMVCAAVVVTMAIRRSAHRGEMDKAGDRSGRHVRPG